MRDRHDDPAYEKVVAHLTAKALEDWNGAAIERRMQTRGEELRLIREWLERARPVEPDPLWLTGEQENWFDPDC